MVCPELPHRPLTFSENTPGSGQRTTAAAGALPDLAVESGVLPDLYPHIAPLLEQNMHISEITGLLIATGLGVVVGNWIGGQSWLARFGATRSLVVSLLLQRPSMLAILPLATTELLMGLPALFLWSAAQQRSVFTPQQHRLLSLAPAQTTVILALNNAALYLGTAGGAIVGGVALHFIAVTQLGWVGASSTLLALLLLLLSLRLSAHASHAQEKTIG